MGRYARKIVHFPISVKETSLTGGGFFFLIVEALRMHVLVCNEFKSPMRAPYVGLVATIIYLLRVLGERCCARPSDNRLNFFRKRKSEIVTE